MVVLFFSVAVIKLEGHGDTTKIGSMTFLADSKTFKVMRDIVVWIVGYVDAFVATALQSIQQGDRGLVAESLVSN